MAKRTAEESGQVLLKNQNKKTKIETPNAVKPNLLDDSSSEDESSGGANIGESEFKINEEFASRFEHNKKREELHRCQFITYNLGTGN